MSEFYVTFFLNLVDVALLYRFCIMNGGTISSFPAINFIKVAKMITHDE